MLCFIYMIYNSDASVTCSFMSPIHLLLFLYSFSVCVRMLHCEIGLIFPGDGVPFSLPLSELLLLPGVQMEKKKKKKNKPQAGVP